MGLDKLTLTDTGADTVVEVQLNLPEGTILGNVGKLSAASKYEVKVPNGVAGIRGTRYRISSTGYTVVLDGTVVFVYVPPQGQPTPYTLVGPPAVYFSPLEGVKPAPEDLVVEVRNQFGPGGFLSVRGEPMRAAAARSVYLACDSGRPDAPISFPVESFKEPGATRRCSGFFAFRGHDSTLVEVSPGSSLAAPQSRLCSDWNWHPGLPRLDFLKRIEWITYDWRMRQASRVQAETGTNFGFVFIGDEAIDVFSRGDLGPDFHFGLYWPRHIYGRLVQELSAQGAKAIGLDILFGELRPDHKTKLRDGTVVSSDAYFTNAMAQAGNVVLGATPEVMPHPIFRAAALSIGHISTRPDADGVLRRVRAFLDHRIWHAEILKQAQLNGWDLEKAQVSSNELVFIQGTKTNRVSLTEDGLFNPYELAGRKPPGGFVRLARAYEDVRVWHLGIVLAAMELGADLSRAKVDLERGRITLSATNGATRVLPVDGEGRLLIDWTMSLNDPRLTQEAFESVIDRGTAARAWDKHPGAIQRQAGDRGINRAGQRTERPGLDAARQGHVPDEQPLEPNELGDHEPVCADDSPVGRVDADSGLGRGGKRLHVQAVSATSGVDGGNAGGGVYIERGRGVYFRALLGAAGDAADRAGAVLRGARYVPGAV